MRSDRERHLPELKRKVEDILKRLPDSAAPPES